MLYKLKRFEDKQPEFNRDCLIFLKSPLLYKMDDYYREGLMFIGYYCPEDEVWKSRTKYKTKRLSLIEGIETVKEYDYTKCCIDDWWVYLDELNMA